MTAVSPDLESQLATLKASAQETIAAADTLDTLEKLRVQYVGKKGEVSAILGRMGKLSAEDRPRIGGHRRQRDRLLGVGPVPAGRRPAVGSGVRAR